ncbi:MAG: DNA gyrase subunit A [Francisellaceae bacterium]|jgi:DNA gyrase subunit A|nr:DNA gyrase subunit A [Francisellaceae bacterium]MBT6539475.1 DNA gyrase subunit A [Francisellaceae bacterium]
MADLASEVTPINIEDELKQSYLDYSMSVIVGRALPDVRDGLKPVHRRVLFAMGELHNDWNKPYKKSARIVGDVVGKYHPHSDTAVYDSIVRMAQPFSMRYMLVDGQGNFGSVDGDPPAAMRYTEVRMSKITHSLLSDLDKGTVDFVPNYDESEMQPTVLPTRVPNLLVNGSSGIAVGMATNVPPHNLGEVVNACLAFIEDENIDLEGIMEHIPGPDFPTAGIINGRAGIIEAYRTGRGRIYVRGRSHFENNEAKNKISIIVTELPYQVNKSRLIEKIAELVKDKKIEGITGLRDESDKDGMRMVVELRRGESGDVILNQLYSLTQLQSVFGINTVALVDGQPRILPIKDIIRCFVDHRRQVVSRRTTFELNKARARAHILEGLTVALVNIDPIIALIKSAKSPQEAREKLLAVSWPPGDVCGLLDRTGSDSCRPDHLSKDYGLHDDSYKLSPEQTHAILELKLHRLTGLEQDRLSEEFKNIIERIAEYIDILSNQTSLMSIIKEELKEVKEQFIDERRTEICVNQEDLSVEDLIQPEEMVVTLSHCGYVKAQPLSTYEAQKRGGKGKIAASVKDEDFISCLQIANSHDTLLCFSSLGKAYWLKVYKLPIASRNSRGRPIINLLPLQENERISAILPIKDFAAENTSIFMATKIGTVKQVSLLDFSRPRTNGIIAMDLADNDSLIGVAITTGDDDILLSTNAGKAIRFSSVDVRKMGRTARGVRGIKLQPNQEVISLIVLQEGGAILTATCNGYGKRTAIGDYSRIGRGGQGVISIQTTERNGEVVGALQVFPNTEVMLISDQGTMVRIRTDEISQVGRNTQGVRLINISTGDKLVGIQNIAEIDEVETPESSNIEEGGNGETSLESDDDKAASPSTDTPSTDAPSTDDNEKGEGD